MLNKNANYYCNIEKKNLIQHCHKYVHWAYCNFPNTLNWFLITQMSITTNKVVRIIKFFFLILLRKATLESKVAPTHRYSSAFLLHTSKTFSNVELFSIFSQTFLELIFATKIKTISYLVYQLSKKYCVYHISEHLKYCSQINEYWLNKNANYI